MTKEKLIIFDVNQTIFCLKKLNKIFVKIGLKKEHVEFWFHLILKEGFATSSLNIFVDFKTIAYNQLKYLFFKNKIKFYENYFEQVVVGFGELNAHDGVKSSFKLLKKNGFKIATLTNGPLRNSIKLLEKNNLYSFVDKCFSIEDVKAWKPHPSAYKNVVKFFKLRPNQGTMIACHGWDLFGARNVGLRTAYCKHYENEKMDYYNNFDFEEKSILELVQKIV